MKPFEQRRRTVCQGSLGGCACLCSVKQRGPVRCKLVLSPLSLWQLLFPQCQLLLALLLLSPCTRPGPAPLLGHIQGHSCPQSLPSAPPSCQGGGLGSTGMEETAATRGLEVTSPRGDLPVVTSKILCSVQCTLPE